MGHGDFKLLAALGAWTGWQYLITIVLLSSLVGAICGLALILLRGRARGAPLPFGPFLPPRAGSRCCGAKTISHAYLRWLGF